MQATIWGCRGSMAVPGPETVRYGGNTSCVQVELDDGTLLVLDAGTGVRPLGLQLVAGDGPVHVLLTHLHLDHLEGLGFFVPVWTPGREVHIWGPRSPLRSLEDRITRYFSPPLFPIDIHDIPCRVAFHDVPEEPWQIGGAWITAEHVSHPGPTVGYRVEGDGTSLAYIPDHEPAHGSNLAELPPDWISGHGVAHRADVLLHDAQYSEEEYASKVGWGHSSVATAVDFARVAGVGRLLLFHHDPLHTDERLVEHEARARELSGGNGVGPQLAAEGMTIELAELVAAAS